MSVLGLRCSNTDYTYAVMSGSRDEPEVSVLESAGFPRNFAKPKSLFWFVQEIEGLMSKHDVQKIVLKAFEGPTRNKSYEERVQYEAAVYVAAGKKGLNAVYSKVGSTIAKDLGLKGRAHYLRTSLDTSVIAGYSEKSDKEKDAMLAAWSELS